MGTKFQILVQATRVGTSAHEPEIYDEIPLKEKREEKNVFEVLGWERNYIPKSRHFDWWKLSGNVDDIAEQIGKDVGAMAADALITGIQHTVIRRPDEVDTAKKFIREKFEESIAGVYQHRLEAEQASAREEYVRMKQALHGEGWTPSPYEEREMDAKTCNSWYILYEIQLPYEYDDLTPEQQERLRGAVKAYLPIQHYEDTVSLVDERDFLVIADERIKTHDCSVLSVENGRYSSQPYPEEDKAKMRKGIDMLMQSIEEERRDADAVLAQVEPIVEQGESLVKALSQDYPDPDKAKKGIFAKFRDVAEKALKKALGLPEKIMGVYSGAIRTLERKKVHQWRAYETAKKYADEAIAKVPDIGAILKQQEERRKGIIRDYQQVTYPIVKTEPMPVSDSDDEKFYAEISKRITEARQPIIDRLTRLEEKVSERKELLLDLMDFGTASLEQRNETIKKAVAATMEAVMEERKRYYLSEERRLQEEIAERKRVEKMKDEMTALAKKKEMLERELREVEKRQDELKTAILVEGNALILQKENEERWKKGDEKSLGREANSKKGRDALWYGR